MAMDAKVVRFTKADRLQAQLAIVTAERDDWKRKAEIAEEGFSIIARVFGDVVNEGLCLWWDYDLECYGPDHVNLAYAIAEYIVDNGMTWEQWKAEAEQEGEAQK
jgi:hypothetical protein